MSAATYLGIAVGLTELAIAYVSLRLGASAAFKWMRLFGVGALLLGLGQLVCKPFYLRPLGVLFKAAGLALLLFSIAEGLGFRRERAFALLVVSSALLFAFGSLDGPALFVLGHVVFLFALPLAVGLLLWNVEKTITIGLTLYASATLVTLGLHAFGLTLEEAMSYSLFLRLAGVVAMFVGLKKPV